MSAKMSLTLNIESGSDVVLCMDTCVLQGICRSTGELIINTQVRVSLRPIYYINYFLQAVR